MQGDRQKWVRLPFQRRERRGLVSLKFCTGLLVGGSVIGSLMGSVMGGVMGSVMANASAMSQSQPQSEPAKSPIHSPMRLSNDSDPVQFTDRDRRRFRQLVRQASQEHWSQLERGELVQRIGEFFVSTPYRAQLLEQPYLKPSRTSGERLEPLTVSFQAFDCMIFVETVLALSQSIFQVTEDVPALEEVARGKNPLESNLMGLEQEFLRQIEQLRYRQGRRGNYCSRLHYFSAWLQQQHAQQQISLAVSSTGAIGLPWQPQVSFMSEHWQKYPALRQSPDLKDCITSEERQVNAQIRQQPLRYIPTPAIAQHYGDLRAGDVVGIVTRVKGLDTTHTGFVYRRGGSVGLLHAAPQGGVQISTDLARYVGQVQDAIGITVARPSPGNQRYNSAQ